MSLHSCIPLLHDDIRFNTYSAGLFCSFCMFLLQNNIDLLICYSAYHNIFGYLCYIIFSGVRPDWKMLFERFHLQFFVGVLLAKRHYGFY